TLGKPGKLPIRQLDRRAILGAPHANRSLWRQARRVGSMEQPIQREARRLQLRIGIAEEGLKAMACDLQPRQGKATAGLRLGALLELPQVGKHASGRAEPNDEDALDPVVAEQRRAEREVIARDHPLDADKEAVREGTRRELLEWCRCPRAPPRRAH